MADLAALQVRRADLIEQISTQIALRASAERTVQRAIARGDTAQADRARAEVEQISREIVRLQALLAELDAQIVRTKEAEQGARQSAGVTVRTAQQARDEAASTTNPPPPALVIEIDGVARPQENDEVTNAERAQTRALVDQGVNAPLRKITQTQATPATLPLPGPPPPNSTGGPQAAFTPGAGANSEDVRASINAIFGGEAAKIVTQDNSLSKYSSYTYSISIYLMSPEDYSRLVRSKTKNLSGFNLLIQSAGIPNSTGFGSTPGVADVGEIPGVTTVSQDQGRNQFFQEDFYIDDVRLKSVISGKGTAGPHNVVSLDFKIIEPNGISLLPRLFKASQAYMGGQGSGDTNYAAQNYLMVIKFLGYDPSGNQYVPITGTLNDAQGNPVTTPTVIEKFIPFQFTNIKFRVADKLTEYSCEAVCPQNLIATGPARGVIPYNVEITSKTLKELFNGPLGFSSPSQTGTITPARTTTVTVPPGTTGSLFDAELGNSEIVAGVNLPISASNTTPSAPAKANAANTPTITQGLAEALNKYQLDLVQQGVYTIPDTYKIEILTPALQNAKVVPPGQTNQRTVPMGPGSKAPANQQKNPATQSQNKDAKNTSALAGMSVIQFIDQYTRTSTYIYDQQIKIRDPKTGKTVPNGTPAEVTAWYRVGLQAVPKTSLGEDPKRNDYAYEITYQLSPYKVNDVQSDYFPQGEFQGTHKKYNYWFTGLNTDILKFEQDFNYLYYLTVNTDQPTEVTGVTTDYREKLKKAFSPRSAQSSMGQQGPTNEASANAADYLYSPADQARIKLEILGDPAWIQQGELWSGIAGTGQIYGPFLNDGTINYEGQEVLFEVAFNQPVDYNLDTGIMDPTAKNFNKTDSAAGDARQSYIYRATDVTSTFSQGRFTQELNGVLILFDLPASKASKDNQDRVAETRTPTPQAAARQRQVSAASASSVPGSWQNRQEQAAQVLGSARKDQYGKLLSNPLGTIFGLPATKDSGATSLWEAEGFGDPTTAYPMAETEAPTSSGQPVGPAASGSAAIRSLGGASGSAVGEPRVSVRLIAGGTIPVISTTEINSLYTRGLITAQERDRAILDLNTKRQAANTPANNRAPQLGAKDF